jgi:hypothetical protein
MKKVLVIIAIVMLVPFTAFGMEMMHDTALENVTGQAGVSISIDNVQMDMSIEYVSWGDDDGIAGYGTNPGYVNMNTIKMTGIIIDKLMIGSAGLPMISGALYTYDDTLATPDVVATAMNPTDLEFLTIDVGDYPEGLDATGTPTGLDTAVRIGVPTLSIYVDKIADITVTLTNSPGADVLTGDTLGTISMGAMQLDTKGGAVYILAH